MANEPTTTFVIQCNLIVKKMGILDIQLYHKDKPRVRSSKKKRREQEEEKENMLDISYLVVLYSCVIYSSVYPAGLSWSPCSIIL